MMHPVWQVALSVGLAVGVLFAPPAPQVCADDKWTELETALVAARAAPQGDKEAVKALTAALTAVAPAAGDLRKLILDDQRAAYAQIRFAQAWNDSLNALQYHGANTQHEYVLVTARTNTTGGISMRLPLSALWTWKYPKTDQHILSVMQYGNKSKLLRHMKIWRYRWDTLYSGVGGENYSKLAKVMHELDRDSMAKQGRKASTRVTAKRLNAEFSRAQFYFVEGFDVDEEARIRRRNYYVKAPNTTYNFEVIDYLDAVPGEDPVTAWLRTVEGPDWDVLLQSLAAADDE